MWLLISSFLLMYIGHEAHAMHIKLAITGSLLTYVVLMFVDDGDFSTIDQNTTETITEVIKRHQATVTCWVGG